MKRRVVERARFTLVLILGLIIVSASLFSESLVISSEVAIAAPAPDFNATDIDGNNVTLSDFRGNVVVLDFMTKWCGACWMKVDEVLIPFWSEYKDKDVVMITICWNASASELRALRGGHPGMDWCLISDPDAYPIAVQYNIRTTPTITIVDKAGYMRYKYESGYSPNLTLDQLKEWVDELLLDSQYLVVRGLDNRIYYRTYNSAGDSWNSWNVVPTGVTSDSCAAAVYSGKLYIVVRGIDGYSLWFGWINLTDDNFSGWIRLSRETPSAPTLVSYYDTLILVVRGLDNCVYYCSYDCVSDEWEGWTVLQSGKTSGSPAAATLGNGLHIVVRGFSATSVYGNCSLWHASVNLPTRSFSGWTKLGGVTWSKPTLTVSPSLNRLYVVVRGLNDHIYYNPWNGINWEGWTRLSTGTTSDGPAASMLGDDLHIVARGKNATTLWHCSINLPTGDHSSWTKIDGQTPSAPTLSRVLRKLQGDIDGDGDVDGFDLTRICGAYGATPENPRWCERCDIIEDDLIDGFDLTIACGNYGKG